MRPHEHPLLELLGVRWRSLDPIAQGWVRDTVTETRQTRQALQP